ncbi:2-polyprenyl-6-methoxyphenol hydroxylase (EC 1.14.13.-) [Mycetohabitans rhizoxinica HKI 454]|uniref:2-polyprenyl-6-methoxyphenol hydroxylase n=1 Tax=Mycetohabitans rhizoxinica (strain DSM 19002 / CIP 109453 / HKI 454) TaxID=882378 RepID=E5ALL8_MYCRK|nr:MULTISPECIES: UbiH/UbiF/VisC/COQ6 family ubiquinone biosynthesis hydroxylase [Mycetohabitans]MCG1047914.1 UbiH/UbiF/VisC/COQ6 family ubiquinone biosynthesis hydroxylase [Mycetohabitans sp. B6]CBW76039.1 2-polyprenyl-6-methoxyphenol hydroxylase (EC 1.14.13.-) [Mycetohabitans rhizoxinica HKI 454]
MTESNPARPAHDAAPDARADAARYDYDVAIVGAGPAGLALAGWLARRGGTRALRVALIDAREPDASLDDPRALALSHGSRMLLEPLGWPLDATPIERIHVSQRGYLGRAVIERDEHGVPALGYVVRYGALVHALATAVRDTGCDWISSSVARAPRQDEHGVWLPIEPVGAPSVPDGDASAAAPQRVVHARLVVNAEGGVYHEAASPRLAAGQHAQRDYRQTALVAVVSVSAPQPRVAWERFTREGPLALLPLGGPRQADYALVWCCDPAQAARRMALSDAQWLDELQWAFGDRMGRFEQVGARAAFPLGLHALTALTDRRIASIGNAAQTLHPVAGQGLNLGLRDAHALLDALAHHGPEPAALRAFTARRALDRRVTIAATDVLARAFTVDFAPLAALRGLALGALDLIPPVKTALARQMMFGQRR